ncbi:MAG: hypothetical protein IKC49_00530 [Clostridia bacterium]|nr:hypothetical protein [Clostridia bacterium]
MKDQKLFLPILDKDEEIKKVYRPSKMRTWINLVVMIILYSIFFVPLLVSALSKNGQIVGWVTIIALYTLSILVSIIFIALWVNKTVYAITDKRILIRTGYIGIDFKSLDYKMLGAMTVSVNWLDKILHKNTGSIAFGSMASPMVNNNIAKFTLSYIKNPYEECKEIKQIIDEHQSK